jgi:hypothetical protein
MDYKDYLAIAERAKRETVFEEEKKLIVQKLSTLQSQA